jgi:hypothetical protein
MSFYRAPHVDATARAGGLTVDPRDPDTGPAGFAP